MSVRIRCINKSGGYHMNPHEAVSHYGWVNEKTGKTGKDDRTSMVAWVEGGGHAYVSDARGSATCFVNTSRAGTKFLQTRADNRWSDNLLSLPECA